MTLRLFCCECNKLLNECLVPNTCSNEAKWDWREYEEPKDDSYTKKIERDVGLKKFF